MKFRIGMLLFAVLAAGCATQGVNSYRQIDSEPVKVENEIVVDRSQPRVWDILIRELSKSSYVINSADKESRLIALSFLSNAPTQYADCGRTQRAYTHGDDVENYEYQSAGYATYKVATERQNDRRYANYNVIQRSSSLEGRPSIYITPDANNPKKTTVSVNTRFTLSFRTSGETFAQHLGNSISRGRLSDEFSSVTFSTDKPGQYSERYGDGVRMTCFSKGKAEKELLELIRNGLAGEEETAPEEKVETPAAQDQKASEKSEIEAASPSVVAEEKNEKQNAQAPSALEEKPTLPQAEEQKAPELKPADQKTDRQRAIEQIAIEKQAEAEKKGKK